MSEHGEQHPGHSVRARAPAVTPIMIKAFDFMNFEPKACGTWQATVELAWSAAPSDADMVMLREQQDAGLPAEALEERLHGLSGRPCASMRRARPA
jgi:hypothetical protein